MARIPLIKGIGIWTIFKVLRFSFFKDRIPDHIYVHVPHLQLATYFLSRASDRFTVNSGAYMLLYFVRFHKLLYGLEEMSMNVH